MTEQQAKLLITLREYGQLAIARSIGAERRGDALKAYRYNKQAQGYAELAVMTETMVVYRKRLPDGRSVFYPG